MTRQAGLAKNEVTRRPRLRLRAALTLIKGGCGPGCDVTVVFADASIRLEVHREAKANGRGCWYAVAIHDDELHDARRATRRWEAEAICREWAKRLT